MTATDEDLRDALRLLEQRAPDVRPDLARAPGRRTGLWRIVAAAAAVVVIAGGAALIEFRHHDGPAQRAIAPLGEAPGPKSHGPAPNGPLHGLATLRVRVTITGGPLLPNGKMAADHRPEAGAKVMVVSVADGGGAYHSTLAITEKTDRHGIATFPLPPGRYRYSSPCDAAEALRNPVRLRAGQAARVAINCDVP